MPRASSSTTTNGRHRDRADSASLTEDELRQDLVGHLREGQDRLRLEWVREMAAKGLLKDMTEEEMAVESATIYDTCVSCLEGGDYAPAQSYAQLMSQRAVLRGMSPNQILGGMLTLRDVFGRSLFERYRADSARLSKVLDIYEPVANRILVIVSMAFIEAREQVVREQQEALRELSTPVLRVRERLLILPVIGLIDSLRARQLTDQLLRSIREHRAKVVVMDITGVAAVDSKVANHLVQTVEAGRLLGATVILTGVSPAIAHTIVTVGIDLSRIVTVGDLEGGIDLADRLLGYRVMSGELGAVAPATGR